MSKKPVKKPAKKAAKKPAKKATKPRAKAAPAIVAETPAATPRVAPVMESKRIVRLYRVWEPGWESAKRNVEADEITAAALEYAGVVYPAAENLCTNAPQYDDNRNLHRVFFRDDKPVPYVFVEEVK